MTRLLMVLALAAIAAPLAANSADVITRPEWLKKPTQQDMDGVWPAEAQRYGISGQAIITCHVTPRGLLEKCEVAEEKPAGMGFGASALALTPRFLMKPALKDGVPVGGGTVRVPINFHAQGPAPGGETISVMPTAPWTETPTAAQAAEAFPKGARGKVDTGHVVTRCKISSAGTLTDCRSLTEEPKNYGFASAALKLTKDFKVRVDPAEPPAKNLYVDVPFDLRSPDKPVPTRIGAALWLRTASPAYTAQVFPAKATQAGLVSGRGVLDCEVTHEGKLTACTVAREDPGGLGFGEAAMQIAAVMEMNPWTTEGVPVDGAHLQVAIRLDLPPEPPKAPAGAPAP